MASTPKIFQSKKEQKIFQWWQTCWWARPWGTTPGTGRRTAPRTRGWSQATAWRTTVSKVVMNCLIETEMRKLFKSTRQVSVYYTLRSTEYSVCEIITILGCQWVLGCRCGINQALLWDIIGPALFACLDIRLLVGWSGQLRANYNYHNQIVEDPIEC